MGYVLHIKSIHLSLNTVTYTYINFPDTSFSLWTQKQVDQLKHFDWKRWNMGQLHFQKIF